MSKTPEQQQANSECPILEQVNSALTAAGFPKITTVMLEEIKNFSFVDASAQAINGNKTVFCEKQHTEQEIAILKEVFKKCFKPSITK